MGTEDIFDQDHSAPSHFQYWKCGFPCSTV